MFIRGKGGKERYVLFGQFAADALHTYLNDGRKGLLKKGDPNTDTVFLNARGTPLTTRGIRLILNKMVEKAALTIHVHPHKRSEEHTSELQSRGHLVCRLLLE